MSGSVAAVYRPRQMDDETWRWVHFTRDDGLPSDKVFDLQQGDDGTVWVATDLGVARYDGFQWSVPAGLPSGKPDQIIAGHDGGLWVVLAAALYRGDAGGFEETPVVHQGRAQQVSRVARFDPSGLLANKVSEKAAKVVGSDTVNVKDKVEQDKNKK